MKLDETLLEIILQIKDEVKEKYKVEMSEAEIYDCIDAQVEATKLGFSRGVTVVWSRFCKFVFSNRAIRRSEVRKTLEKLDDNEDITPQEREQRKKDKIISAYAEKKKYLTKEEKEKTAKEVLDAPIITKTNIMLFKGISKNKRK